MLSHNSLHMYSDDFFHVKLINKYGTTHLHFKGSQVAFFKLGYISVPEGFFNLKQTVLI